MPMSRSLALFLLFPLLTIPRVAMATEEEFGSDYEEHPTEAAVEGHHGHETEHHRRLVFGTKGSLCAGVREQDIHTWWFPSTSSSRSPFTRTRSSSPLSALDPA